MGSPKIRLRKCFLNIYSKFTREHPCQSVISVTLLCSFIKVTYRHRCSPINLLYIFRAPVLKNISGWLLLKFSEVQLVKSYLEIQPLIPVITVLLAPPYINKKKNYEIQYFFLLVGNQTRLKHIHGSRPENCPSEDSPTEDSPTTNSSLV